MFGRKKRNEKQVEQEEHDLEKTENKLEIMEKKEIPFIRTYIKNNKLLQTKFKELYTALKELADKASKGKEITEDEVEEAKYEATIIKSKLHNHLQIVSSNLKQEIQFILKLVIYIEQLAKEEHDGKDFKSLELLKQEEKIAFMDVSKIGEFANTLFVLVEEFNHYDEDYFNDKHELQMVKNKISQAAEDYIQLKTATRNMRKIFRTLLKQIKINRKRNQHLEEHLKDLEKYLTYDEYDRSKVRHNLQKKYENKKIYKLTG